MTNNLNNVFEFLELLKENNDREWFQQHKDLYEAANLNMINFADSLLEEMRIHDDIQTISGKKSLYRIYRDVRFSKVKTPYKTSWNGYFKRRTNALRGGYNFHIEPGNTYIVGGFFGPNPSDLKLIRNHIEQDDKQLRDILEGKSIKSFFGSLRGRIVKTAPRGFDINDPSIDLLRYKQFMLKHNFSDKEVLDKNFHMIMSESFQKLRPFFDAMSEMLTTDLNGISSI